MAYQQPCEQCNEYVNEYDLIHIDHNQKALCHSCVNDLIEKLNEQVSDLELEIKLCGW